MIKSNKYFKLFIGLSFILFSGCNPEQKIAETPPPNIIFLLADDLRDDMFAAMGHPLVQSPNIDKLIQQGVRFKNTYIAEPVCSPSRTSLFNGMYERMHGVGFSSSYQLTEEQWENSYPAIMRKNGYYTGFIGKFGVEYYDFDNKEKYDYFYGHDGLTKFFPKEYDSPSCKTYHQAQHDIITAIMGEAINNFLDSAGNKSPFCLSVSFSVPHGSQTKSMYTGFDKFYTMSRPANLNPKLQGHPVYDTLYRNVNIKIPETTGSDPYQYIPKYMLDQNKGRDMVYVFSYTDSTCYEHHIRYYQTITGIDKIIGEMMKKLEQQGIADNTIIIFASDHGLLMGEYGMGGKALLYDLTSKIPFFIYDPRLPENLRGQQRQELISSLDIPATMLDYAGLPVPEQMQGRSIVPLLNNETVAWRDELFLESLFTMRDNPFCEGIRQGDWKYIRMYDGVNPYREEDLYFSGIDPGFEQLFNVKDDPGETNNLIEQYQSSEMLKGFREKVSNYAEEMNRQRQDYKQKTIIKEKSSQ